MSLTRRTPKLRSVATCPSASACARMSRPSVRMMSTASCFLCPLDRACAHSSAREAAHEQISFHLRGKVLKLCSARAPTHSKRKEVWIHRIPEARSVGFPKQPAPLGLLCRASQAAQMSPRALRWKASPKQYMREGVTKMPTPQKYKSGCTYLLGLLDGKLQLSNT